MTRHLAIFLPSLDGGGAEKVMITLARQFVARDVKCDLVISCSKGQLMNQVPDGIRVVELGKKKTTHAILSLAKYLRRERPGALMSTIFPANITALIAGMLAQTPRIVIREANHVNIDIESDSYISTRLNQLAAGFLYRRADAVVAVAKSVRQSLIKSGYINASRIYTISNPITISKNQYHRGESKDNINIILACGRLERQKDYPTMLHAFAKLRRNMHVKLVILGEGSLENELKALAVALGVENDVTFSGFEPDAVRCMQAADAFVHTATFEGMSNVILEALSVGCPIVATDSVGGVAEVLGNGRYGTLVPVGDAEAVAKALEQILTGAITFPDAQEHLKKFDLEEITEAYLSVLFPNF
jgi:glycosyltransferase involved in cell wall biosynthesis